MNEHKVCLVNSIITGGFGILLLLLLVSFLQDASRIRGYIVFAYLVVFLLLPLAYYTTLLFIRLEIKIKFFGFLVGGIFSLINTLIIGSLILLITGMLGIFPIYAVIAGFIGFVVGSISGAVITAINNY